MSSEWAPSAAGDGSTWPAGPAAAAEPLGAAAAAAEQAAAAQGDAMPHIEAAAAGGTSTEDVSGATTSSEGQPPVSKKQRRTQKEMAMLGRSEPVATDGGRPSRRAANAAQVAIAQTYAFEGARGAGDMSPPQRAKQAAAMQTLEEAAGRGGRPWQQQQQPAGKQQPLENGATPGKKRKRGGASPGADSPSDGGGAAAAPAQGQHAGAATPAVAALHAPSQTVDLEPMLELARQSETQEVLRNRLQERYPPARGRAHINTAFRDLFLTLCPGQIFHGRSSALPHMSHHLFRLAGKPVGKPPAAYKPRGPRSPSTGTATPGLPPKVPSAHAGVPPAAAAQPPAAAAGQPPAGSAGLAGGGAQLAHGDALGPAAAAAARAAATASGELPVSSAGGLDAKAAMARITAEGYPAELIRFAALVRRTLGMQRGGTAAHLRMMLKTLHLAGQKVRFQSKAGKILNYGRLSEEGGIQCFCKQCNGKEVSASEFEEHSGSKDRRPADGIFLESCNRSLKELLNLINSAEMAACTEVVDVHMEACYHCNKSGELLCCDGCTCAFHTSCVNLDVVPQGDWFCPLCQAAGITEKPKPMLPLQPKQLAIVKPPKASKNRTPSGGKLNGKLSKKGGAGEASAGGPPSSKAPSKASYGGGGGGGSGRVHMAAPMAPRAPRLGRPGARSNKNKRLFEGEEGALINGQKLLYKTTQGEVLLEGVAVIERGGPSGILCGCCSTLISASGFEAHAGRGQRRAPYDNIFTEDGMTLKAMAALLPDLEDEAAPARQAGEYGMDDLADDAREVISELDTLAGGCVLCHEVDFQRGGFGPRTIMLCDQCEREFHVGCLKKCGKCELDAVPEGDWYCSEECERIRRLVGAAVQEQQMDIPGYPSHTWQVMRGKDGRSATGWSLRAAQEILQESFDPIMDLASNTDLLPVMLYARRSGEWDYSNCLTLLLRHKGKPVVAAIVRVFGPQLAELPLIATKNTARRQGHARILVDCFQNMLKQAGVHTLVLPAAHETVETWKSGFQFTDMPEDDCRLAKQQLRILIFPGTEVLWKHFPEVPAPKGHHILVPPPDRPSPEEAADAMEVAAITANMVACVSAACGEPILPEMLGMTTDEAAAAVSAPVGSAAGGGAAQPAGHPAAAAAAAAPRWQQQAGALPPAVQQQQQQPVDEYEAMIAAAHASADQQFAAGGAYGRPGRMAGNGPAGYAQQRQPQPASSSDVSISDDDDDDDDDDATDSAASEPPYKRSRQG